MSRTRIRHDTLIEAIADVLERDHGFVFVGDDRLAAAVNVSTEEADNFLVDLRPEYDDGDDGDDDGDDEDDDEPRGDFRTIVTDVEFDLDGSISPELTAPATFQAPASLAEEDLQHVAVADLVGLAFRAQPAVLARLGDGARGSAGPRRRRSRPG